MREHRERRQRVERRVTITPEGAHRRRRRRRQEDTEGVRHARQQQGLAEGAFDGLRRVAAELAGPRADFGGLHLAASPGELDQCRQRRHAVCRQVLVKRPDPVDPGFRVGASRQPVYQVAASWENGSRATEHGT